MAEFIEFRQLERLSEKPNDFLSALDNELRARGIEDAIKLLRLSGICVDLYNTKKYRWLLEESIKLINSYDKERNESLAKLLVDVHFLDILFNSFGELRSTTGVSTLSADRQIPAFLLAAEIFLGSLTAYAHLQNKDEIKKIYPFIIAFGDENDNLVLPDKVITSIVQLYDRVTEQLGLILKYLYYTGAMSVGLNSLITIDEIIASRDHIYLFDRYDVLYKSHEYWRFWGAKILSQKESKISFSPIVETDFISQSIGTFRSRIRRNKWMQDFRLIMDKIPVDPTTNQLPPKGYRLPEEYLSENFCYDYFGSDDLSEQILGISLAEWIRAYTILDQVSNLFIEARKNIKPFILREWCVAKTEQEWVRVFEINGIKKNKAEVIVKSLTFDKNAKDLIDCPLIPVDDCLVLLPSLTNNISPADAILSNFIHKKLDMGFRGKGLEKRVLATLSQNGIEGKNVKSRDQNEEYECDIVFLLEENLFFVECKAFLQPDSPRTYYELVDKITSASTQLERISSFYERNIDVIKGLFELPNDWRPKQIHKIIVSSALIGQPLYVNDCYVTDESILRRFFDREAPGIAIGHVAIPIPNEDYRNEITVEKLIRVISEPPPIELVKSMMTKRNMQMELNNLSFSFDKLEGLELSYLSRKKLKKLAKSLKVSASYLRKKIDG